MDNNKIDEMYEKLINTSDSVLTDGITQDTIDTFNEIKENLEYDDQKPDEALSEIEIPDNIENDSSFVKVKFDPVTGNKTVIEEIDKEELENRSIENLTTDSTKNVNSISKYIKSSNNDQLTDEECYAISTLIIKRMNGETTGFYDGLPESIKKLVRNIAFGSNTNNIKKSNIKGKNAIAREMIDSIIDDIKKNEDMAFNIDSIVSDADIQFAKELDEASVELAGILKSFDDKRKEKIDESIAKCEKNGNIEGAQKLREIRNNIDNALNLTEFIEFCKTCKIKKFDIEKPSRSFNSFILKYSNSQKAINDITSCPAILDRHLTMNTHDQNMMILIAFCKFAENLDPEIVKEHTFMYYFIRNIISIDRMCPRGERNYDYMDFASKDFYNTFTENLYKATSCLLTRNPSFNNFN